MAGKGASRWADDEDDVAAESQRKKEKEEKKRLKAEKQRQAEEAAARVKQEQEEAATTTEGKAEAQVGSSPAARPPKRRKLSPEPVDAPGANRDASSAAVQLLRFPTVNWKTCRSVEDFEKLNDIEEGAYGWVSRARDTRTKEIVALKRLKIENAQEGVPVTGLREIQTLMDCEHPNIVGLREVVVGEDTSKIESIFLVLDFLEHDLKTLLEDMSEPFLTSEIKTLMQQLAAGVAYLHERWILHRDLKTSNLLLNNRGVLKIADFGMARYGGDPAPAHLTPLVVTLWYRAPELLLGTSTYGPPIDLWSVGCIFGELLANQPLLPGKNEVDELSRIFELCGLPTDDVWPGFRRLPHARALRLPASGGPTTTAHGAVLRAKFPFLTTTGSALLTALLSLDPRARPTAAALLAHPFFTEAPLPKRTTMFPTFPSRAGLEHRRRPWSPSAPLRGAPAPDPNTLDFSGIFARAAAEQKGAGFSLKLI